MKNRQQCAFVVWFTGLPCSGKTTLARLLSAELEKRGLTPECLDGDDLRKKLSADLGFAREDREEHGRRVVREAQKYLLQGRPVIVSLVSPYQSMRQYARETLDPFLETYLDCSLDVCEARDVKGMYRLARNGRIQQFTGVSDEYEVPENPEIILATGQMTPEACIQQLLMYLDLRGLLPSK